MWIHESTWKRCEFDLAPLDTEQRNLLQTAKAHPVTNDADDVDDADDTANILVESEDEEIDKRFTYNFTVARDGFMDLTLANLERCIYVKDMKHVTSMSLNVGTKRTSIMFYWCEMLELEKSWFQIYALKQLLLSEDRKFDFVIRQVGNILSLIDLEEAVVYRLIPTYPDMVYDLAKAMQRTLYFSLNQVTNRRCHHAKYVYQVY